VRTIHKGSIAGAAAVAGSTVALLSTASPAFAGTFTQPTSNPFTVPVVQSGAQAGTPLTFPVAGTGYPATQAVFIEICDGLPSSNPNWDPTINCDLATSPAPSNASSTGAVSWPATNASLSIVDFRGQSPQAQFNCVAQEDVPSGTPTFPDGGLNLDGVNGGLTKNGETIAQGVESWTNCQLRMSSSNQAATTDQAFITLTIPNTPTGVPETSFAVLLPIGAAGLLAAGLIVSRRRRRTARMAA
jgi:hypothetical protein